MSWRSPHRAFVRASSGFSASTWGASALALAFVGLLGCGAESGEDGSDGRTSGGGGPQSGGTGGAASGGAASGGAASGGTGGSGGEGTGAVGGSGGAGSGGATSLACREPSEAGPLTTNLPCSLSETGLYEADMVTLAPGVRPYRASFELWSDGAEKKRWIELPPDTKIDTSNMDFWAFPAGTKLWKEFTRDGIRVETRLIQKRATGSWYTVAYQWRPDQTDADAVPNGVVDASGTGHDIPNAEACLTCHGQQPDKVLGFSALQLSHEPLDASDPLEWTLGRLMDEELLTAPPAAVFSLPGTEAERAFFGYLHANCGHCHNPTGTANVQTGLDMWLKVAELGGPVTQLSVYQALYDVDIVWLDGAPPNAGKRIAPGALEESAVYQRFVSKGQSFAMPPLGSEALDSEGKQIFETWIQSLR